MADEIEYDMAKYCLEHRAERLKATGRLPNDITLNPDQFTGVMCLSEFMSSLPPPSAPIKSTSERITQGFFSSDTITTTTFDYDSPSYLAEIEGHRVASIRFRKDYPNGVIFGMKVILAD